MPFAPAATPLREVGDLGEWPQHISSNDNDANPRQYRGKKREQRDFPDHSGRPRFKLGDKARQSPCIDLGQSLQILVKGAANVAIGFVVTPTPGQRLC